MKQIVGFVLIAAGLFMIALTSRKTGEPWMLVGGAGLVLAGSLWFL